MKCPFLKTTKTKHNKDNWNNRLYDVVTEEFGDCTVTCMAYDEKTKKCSMLLKKEADT